MTSVKTAISIPRPLFERVDGLAHELNISRSQLFTKAIEEFIRDLENRQLLEQINSVYADGPDPKDQEFLSQMKSLYWRTLEREKW